MKLKQMKSKLLFVALKIWLDPEERAVEVCGVIKLLRLGKRTECGLSDRDHGGSRTAQRRPRDSPETAQQPIELFAQHFALLKKETQNAKQKNNLTKLKSLLSLFVFVFVCLSFVLCVFVWIWQFASLSTSLSVYQCPASLIQDLSVLCHFRLSTLFSLKRVNTKRSLYQSLDITIFTDIVSSHTPAPIHLLIELQAIYRILIIISSFKFINKHLFAIYYTQIAQYIYIYTRLVTFTQLTI